MSTLTFNGSPANTGGVSAFGKWPQGGLRFAVVDVAFTGTYAAGGDTLDPKKFNMTKIIAVFSQLNGLAADDDVYEAVYNRTSGKLELWRHELGGTGAANDAVEYLQHADAGIADTTQSYTLLIVGI